MAILGYLLKLKRGLGLAGIICMIFSQRCSLFNTLSTDKPFAFSRYQAKCVISRQLMTSYLRFIFDHPLKQWPTEKKRGEDGNAKI